jgi:thiol-disulfide isomerase/thioredoxin
LEFVLRLILLVLAMLAISGCDRQNPESQQGEAAAGVPVKGVDRSHKGEPFPQVTFLQDDGDGVGEMTFEPFLGVPTLVNFWASWCAPCVKELPTLKKIAWTKDRDLWVLPMNQDNGPQTSVRAFMARHGVAELGNYQDPKMAVSGALGIQVLPTSVLYDAQGREIWRYVGDLDWTGAEAQKLLDEAR